MRRIQGKLLPCMVLYSDELSSIVGISAAEADVPLRTGVDGGVLGLNPLLGELTVISVHQKKTSRVRNKTFTYKEVEVIPRYAAVLPLPP